VNRDPSARRRRKYHGEKPSGRFDPERLFKPLVRCKCGKVFNPTEKDARRTQRHVEKHKGNHNPVRFYQCKYMGWHWTQQLHEVRQCQSCWGSFRPSNDKPADITICDTCENIQEQEAS